MKRKMCVVSVLKFINKTASKMVWWLSWTSIDSTSQKAISLGFNGKTVTGREKEDGDEE